MRLSPRQRRARREFWQAIGLFIVTILLVVLLWPELGLLNR